MNLAQFVKFFALLTFGVL